jgi:hypothetical protein
MLRRAQIRQDNESPRPIYLGYHLLLPFKLGLITDVIGPPERTLRSGCKGDRVRHIVDIPAWSSPSGMVFGQDDDRHPIRCIRG